MFINHLNQILQDEKYKIDISNAYENLTDEEKKVLEWLSLVINKKKSVVDELGINQFGPYFYYSTMNRLMQKDLMFELIDKGKVYYVIPRELDLHILNEEKNKNNKLRLNNKKLSFFNIKLFQMLLLLYLHHQIQEGSKDLNHDLDAAMNKWFSEKAAEIMQNMNVNDVCNSLENNPDDFVEYYAFQFFQNMLQHSGPYSPLFVKKIIWGSPIQLEEEEKLNQCIVKQLEDNDLLISTSEGQDSSLFFGELTEEIIHLQGFQWLVSTKLPLVTIWRILVISEVLSVGQMLQVSISPVTIEKSKKMKVSVRLWKKTSELLPVPNEQQREQLEKMWEDPTLLVKRNHFVLYEVKSPTLLKELGKSAKKFLNGGEFFIHESGIFVSQSSVIQWEKYVKSASLPIKEAETLATDSKEMNKFNINSPKKMVPNEWREVNQLPETSFQLMMYKENMIARLIRQSQALKLPILIEDVDNMKFVAEINTLKFKPNESVAITYKGHHINLQQIKRLAILHPEKETKVLTIK
ncbi:hypothetical protein QA612_12520 [Evansella sp. AB-P1]|uniref:hypothetical protein n=1 Tax=Evansella sp. AB-P1 TaxID=3037653 RepID=UPI00241EB349|nr:hypothetical protein [Evansella sp. AB-P1]MDG5788316.1 hypothetical protein [Evansella sp. AB-P1]